MLIGIIGNGFVGKATYQLQCKDIKILAYDINPLLCNPKHLQIEDLLICDIIFISVPTPMKENGECSLAIVKSVVKQLKDLQYKNFIVLRSTVPCGTSDALGVYFMPEFLTEKNFIQDFIHNKDWIFGLPSENKEFTQTITTLFNLAKKNNRIKNNTIHFLKNKEAEMVKLFRNCFLATKVSFCNEIYQYCKSLNINYEIVRKLAANDSRILHSHTFVPGPDGKKGFGGTCFPKDTNSLRYEMKKSGVEPIVLSSVISRNEKIDRPEQDWLQSKGRAVVSDYKYKKTILIAGGAGFIGSNMCKKLLQKDVKIICVDNLCTGTMKNIKDLISKKNFLFIEHNIINPLHIPGNIDEIYHFACPASPPKYQIDPIFTLKTNFIGTMNLLDLAKEKKCKILLSSTSEVYGEPTISPQPENYRGNVNTVGIRSCYDEGKRVAETLMMDYHKKYNVDTRIVRIFNTYGPQMDIKDGRVVTNFIYQMLNNKDITIYGDGKQTRSFCYIDDLMDGMIKLMKSEYVYPVNIGSDYEISIVKLANILLELTESKSKIIYLPLPKDDPTHRKPDICLANNILKWKPTTNVKDGLLKTIQFIKYLEKS